MTKKTRTILFFTCLFLFLLVAPLLIFYSQGYRFDLESKKLSQTGGLYLKATPKQSEIYIDGKLIKKTDFFFGSTLIENLLPQKYKITIKKDGYYPWEKDLEIKEKTVTEAKSVVLFHQNPDFKVLTTGVENFWFLPNGKSILLKEGGALTDDGWFLKIYDEERNVKSYLIGEKDIYQKGAELLSLETLNNPPEIYLKIGMKEQVKEFSLRYDRVPPILVEKATTTIPGNIITFERFNNDIYYLDKYGFVFKADSSFTPTVKINEVAFPVKQETEYKIEIFQNYVFLQEGQISYLFNPDSKSFEKFFEPTKNLKISSDNKKMVYFSDYEIWILFLDNIFDQPQRQAGEKLFLTRFSEKIGDIFWLNENYLTFNVGNKLKIAEIDNRDKINIYDLGEFNNPAISFNPSTNEIYVLTEGKLYVSVNLLP